MVARVTLRQHELTAIEHVINDWISCEPETDTLFQKEKLAQAMAVLGRIHEALEFLDS